ncbi:hypothetical protein MACK_002533 [Theileria orientalis]|uniref:Uncharacterized protein n=1 Tax=Theileria orientalis TaxID=68886 RepID=A0A976MD46_THEOR|nr:hypothetical protein MACK_002533 [Theileria orientalis]
MIGVGKSGIFVLDSNGRISETISNEPFISNSNGCVISKNQLCISQLDKAKLVFLANNQLFRASVPEIMTSLEFSSEGELLFCGSRSGKLYVWQVRLGNLLFCEQIFYNEITDVKIDCNNSNLLLSSSNGDLCLVDLLALFSNKLILKNYLGHTSHVLSVCNLLYGIHSSKVSFLSVSRDRNLRFWHQDNVNTVHSKQLTSNPIKMYKDKYSICCYITCEDGNLITVDLNDFSINYSKLHGGPIYSCVELDNLITFGIDGIKIWDKSNDTLLKYHQSGISLNHLFGGNLPDSSFKFKLLKFHKQEDDRERYIVPVSM